MVGAYSYLDDNEVVNIIHISKNHIDLDISIDRNDRYYVSSLIINDEPYQMKLLSHLTWVISKL